MKRKICILLILLFSISAKADNQTQILIDDPKNQSLIIFTIDSDHKVRTISIDKNILLPITCLNNQITEISSFHYTNSYECLIDSINQSYHLNISQYVQLNHDFILKDFNINTKMDTGKEFIDTGSQFLQNLSFSTILNYKKYISTSYKLSDLYQLFQFYLHKPSKTDITYETVSYIITDNGYVPLNKNFEKENTAS